MDLTIPLLAVTIIVIISFMVACYFIGKKISRITFENKGHEEVEKHIIKQVNQIEDITDKYNDLRDRMRSYLSNIEKDNKDQKT